MGLSNLKTQTVQGGHSPVRVLPTRNRTAAWRPKRKCSTRRLTRCPWVTTPSLLCVFRWQRLRVVLVLKGKGGPFCSVLTCPVVTL